MKKIVFGSALLIGGILLTTLSVIGAKDTDGGLIVIFPWIGIALFIIGIALGIKGLNDTE